MSDLDRVLAHLDYCEEYGIPEMPHGAARTVASWYHDGGLSDTYAFVSTGAIRTESTDDLWRQLTAGGRLYSSASPDERRALDWLGTYLVSRRDDRGPVAGWSDLWVGQEVTDF